MVRLDNFCRFLSITFLYFILFYIIFLSIIFFHICIFFNSKSNSKSNSNSNSNSNSMPNSTFRDSLWKVLMSTSTFYQSFIAALFEPQSPKCGKNRPGYATPTRNPNIVILHRKFRHQGIWPAKERNLEIEHPVESNGSHVVPRLNFKICVRKNSGP